MVRLELLRLNTAPALDPARARRRRRAARADLGASCARSAGCPSRCCAAAASAASASSAGTRRSTLAADGVRGTAPRARSPSTSPRAASPTRSTTRRRRRRAFFGTNHVDNSARLCHAASTVAMKATLGYGASTCSYTDWLGADLIVFFGSNVANNQPVTTKYLHYAKAARRAGRRRQSVSRARAGALLGPVDRQQRASSGTRIADDWFDVHTGGDLAFLVGVLKALDRAAAASIARSSTRTPTGFADALAQRRGDTTWETIERESGVAARRHRGVRAPAASIGRTRVFVWSMGLTQHAHGVDTVRALVNLGLARGLPGATGARPGADPRSLGRAGRRRGRLRAGGVRGDARAAGPRRGASTPPAQPGWTATEADRPRAPPARSTRFWMVGGNFLETLPDAAAGRGARWRGRACASIRTSCCRRRCWSTAPATCCSCRPRRATNRRAAAPRRRPSGASSSRPRFRAGASDRREAGVVGVRRGDGARRSGARRISSASSDAAAIRREIARAVPLYAGIERPARPGRLSAVGRTGASTPTAASPPPTAGPASQRSALREPRAGPGDRFFVSTRRGKQFNSMVQRDVDPLTGAARDDDPDQRRRSGAASAARPATTRCCAPRPGVFRGRAARRADPRRQPRSALAGGQRAARRRGRTIRNRWSRTTTPSSRSRPTAADAGAPGLPEPRVRGAVQGAVEAGERDIAFRRLARDRDERREMHAVEATQGVSFRQLASMSGHIGRHLQAGVGRPIAVEGTLGGGKCAGVKIRSRRRRAKAARASG